MAVPKRRKPVKVRSHKRKPAARKPRVRVPGMKAGLLVEGDQLNVRRTPMQINVGPTPARPIVRRVKRKK